MNLLFDSHVPRYAQLAELFRQRIARGIWAPSVKLPSLDVLAREFNVARVTVRQAMGLLARDGLISARQGRGTFVTGRKSSNRWLRVETTLHDLSEMYRGDKPELLNVIELNAIPTLTEKEGVSAPKYFYMRRMHSRDGVPYCVIGIYLDDRIFRMDPARFKSNTVIPLLESLAGVEIAAARQTLTIGTADTEVARHLRIPVNAPVAEVRRVFNASDGTVIYLGEATYRGDFVHLEMDLKS